MSLIDRICEPIEGDIAGMYNDKSDSEIAQYFAGRKLFITGITGYLGKCLLEKLLRSCSEVEHIYVLMREKKKMSLEERAKKYFENEVFNTLREQCPDFQNKVTVFRGDLMSDKLGISEEDRSVIINNVDIIYHNAANVRFDSKISEALKANVLGTKQMLELAQECKNIDLFIYVSTAYSHCYRKDIEEQFYQPPADLKSVYKIIESDETIESGLSEEAVNVLKGQYPNIYAYTKAIAEDVVQQYARKSKFAHAIYRPSIVTSACKEPLAGWVGNANGPIYLLLAGSLGLCHTAYYLGHPMDFIPSDFTINALIAMTPDAHDQWKKNRHQALIYNYGSSTTNPTSLTNLFNIFDNLPINERSSKAVWLNFDAVTDRLWLFYILHILVHFIPACILDLIFLVSGKKPKILSIFWKVTKQLDKLHYFMNGNWKIHMPRTLDMIDRMSPADNEIFSCDIRTLCWKEYTHILWRGLKRFMLKEEIVSEAGLRRYYLLWCLHYGLIVLLLSIFAYLLKITIF